ncbi:MAG TPA: hypothetical protein VMU99_10210 [Acidimicrobiales bacterium]|nr:hypothetical protein [Acidimicrobiales bacterium]
MRRISEQTKDDRIGEAIETLPAEIVTDKIALGSGDDIAKVLQRFRDAGCTRVLVAAYPCTLEQVSVTLRELAHLTR